MPSRRSGKKAKTEEHEGHATGGAAGTVASRALALRPPRSKLALAGAGLAAAAVAVLATLLARRRRD
ncbi:MAG TPA: hypothetical protein VGG41_18185 [Solirubrobacteraceae bacterium]|jgi:hypothetical protein